MKVGKKPLARWAGLWSAAIALQIVASHPRQTRRYAALRVVLGVVFFWISLLAVDADAHKCLHEDAGHSNHECFLTLLAQGQVEVTGDAVLVMWFAGIPAVVSQGGWAAPFNLSLRLPPSCGPPVA